MTDGPLVGIAAVRWAIAKSAGWEWCDKHQRARWDGEGTCRTLHPEPPDPTAPVWCTTCERMHGPMDWGDGCEEVDAT